VQNPKEPESDRPQGRDRVLAIRSFPQPAVFGCRGWKYAYRPWCVSNGARGRTPSRNGGFSHAQALNHKGGIASSRSARERNPACSRCRGWKYAYRPWCVSNGARGRTPSRNGGFSHTQGLKHKGGIASSRSAREPNPARSDVGDGNTPAGLVRFLRRARTRALPWLSPRVSHHILGPVAAGLFF
jgi:hypothetical protein